ALYRAIPIFLAAGEEEAQTIALLNLGMIDHEQGLFDQAKERFEQTIERAKMLGDLRTVAMTCGLLGVCLQEAGRLPDARLRYAEALSLYRDQQRSPYQGMVAGWLGALEAGLGRLHQARRCFEEAEACRDLSYRTFSTIFSLCAGHLDLAYARAAAEACDP